MLSFFQYASPHRRELSSSWRVSRLWMADAQHVVGLALLRVAALAQRERLELPPLVSALAEEHRGFARRRLRQLAQLLQAGTPFVQAVEQCRELLSDEQVLALRFADKTGTTQATFNELIERAATKSHDARYLVREAIMYGACLTLIVGLVLSFLMTFISPTFKHMFQEFGLRLPYALLSLLRASDVFVRYLPIAAIGLPVLAGLAWLIRPMRWFRHWMSSRIVRSIAQMRVSGLLRMLALSLDAGRPLPASLSTLAQYHFDRRVRMKLLVARNEVEQGADAWISLAHANLLSDHEAQALQGASTNQLRVWLMRRMAIKKEDAVESRKSFVAMLVHPFIVIAFGVIVLWITLAFFSVLISMILALS